MISTKRMALCTEENCIYLQSFIQFLENFQIDIKKYKIGDRSDGAVELQTCATRGHNESYTLKGDDEIQAEIYLQIWNQLCKAQCPEHFKIAIFRIIELEILKIWNYIKQPKGEQLTTIIKILDNLSDIQTMFFDSLQLQKILHRIIEHVIERFLSNTKRENVCYADCCVNSNSSLLYRFIVDSTPYVQGAIKNKPRKMEDKCICLARYSDIFQLDESYSFYGVFDGHSGALAAAYASNQLPYLIAQQLKHGTNNNNNNNKVNNTKQCSDYYREIFENAFLQADKNFCEKQITSGTTAVCALLKHSFNKFEHLYVAWVGDSKALLVSPTMHLQLVKPHKPDSTDERKRIECQEMGSILLIQGQWRVNGIINVSRSIGDHSVKTVIAEPDFVDVSIQMIHDFLILCTDGLWDHVTEEEIVQTVYTYIVDNKYNLEDIPARLIELAKLGDSFDNITVVIIFLKDRSKIIQNYSKYVPNRNITSEK